MLGDIGRGTTIFTTKRQALGKTAGDEGDRREIADGVVARQQADHEGRETHDRHGDEEGIFAADEIAEATEEQRAEGTHGKARGKAEEHEDELRGVVRTRHEGGGNVGGQRSCEIEIIPFEDSPGGRGKNDLALLCRHGAVFFARCCSCHAHESNPWVM